MRRKIKIMKKNICVLYGRPRSRAYTICDQRQNKMHKTRWGDENDDKTMPYSFQQIIIIIIMCALVFRRQRRQQQQQQKCEIIIGPSSCALWIQRKRLCQSLSLLTKMCSPFASRMNCRFNSRTFLVVTTFCRFVCRTQSIFVDFVAFEMMRRNSNDCNARGNESTNLTFFIRFAILGGFWCFINQMPLFPTFNTWSWMGAKIYIFTYRSHLYAWTVTKLNIFVTFRFDTERATNAVHWLQQFLFIQFMII